MRHTRSDAVRYFIFEKNVARRWRSELNPTRNVSREAGGRMWCGQRKNFNIAYGDRGELLNNASAIT